MNHPPRAGDGGGCAGSPSPIRTRREDTVKSVMQRLSLWSFAVAAATALSAGPVHAQGELTLYCSPQIEWCEAMKTAFQKETGITVAMTRKSSGETYAQVKAEAANPKGDIWWGGTGDPHLQAAEEGLTEEYKSPMLERAAGLGDSAAQTEQAGQDRRHLLRRARLRLQHRTAEGEGLLEAEVLGRPDQARIQGRGPGRQPELVGHRLHVRSPRWCRSWARTRPSTI